MRVLVLTYETPEYPGGGGASRMANLLEPLATAHDIRVVSSGGPPRLGTFPRRVELRLVDSGGEYHPPGSWLVKNLRHYLAGPPWLHWLARHHLETLATVLGDEVRRFRPDVVQVEHGEIGALLGAVPDAVARVLVLHNLLTVVQWQQVRGLPRWTAFKHLLEVPVMAREERRHMASADVVVTTTEHDRRLARRLHRGVPVTVVPNCVRTGDLRRRPAPHHRPTVVFTASFHYPPNQVAAAELLDLVFPEVRRRVPSARLVLAGQRLPDRLRRRAQAVAGVEVRSPLDDVGALLAEAWAAVAPLRLGSGSPLKVVEALAAAVPVVAAPRVARALGVDAATGVLVAADPPQTAEALVRLLRDAALRRELGARGAAHAAVAFDHLRAAQALAATWELAVTRARSRTAGRNIP